MYNKIIIASALDQGFAQRAIQTAKILLTDNGKIIALHVVEPVNNVVQSFVSEEAKSQGHKTIQEMMSDRFGDDQHIESVILSGHPGSIIPAHAKMVGADCIIVGSHKPGLEDFFLGSTSSRIVRHASCSVHVLR
ncbi:universal stress protein [Hoeflea sp.]|uniref:universal stress protein n=1 Tax=Hoeflea sp. TaxID=1940281 RepID=UPI003B026E22